MYRGGLTLHTECRQGVYSVCLVGHVMSAHCPFVIQRLQHDVIVDQIRNSRCTSDAPNTQEDTQGCGGGGAGS